ncbi:MAG TPA: hypothetical protein ENI06_04970, partial [Spirochaetales bacterium]|nr:hypothetical protein [Spirochaetales bacterium]
MGLTMRERKAVIKQTAARYRRSSKKQKAKILDEFVETTGYNRRYAGWILRNWCKKRYIRLDGQLIEVVMRSDIGVEAVKGAPEIDLLDQSLL